MYGQVARPNNELQTLMDQFVCVRITRISRINHGVFQFDKNLSFAVLFMNGSMDLYGRYGTRSGGGFSAPFRSLPGQEDLADRDISGASFTKAAEKALELHSDWKKDGEATSKVLAPKLGTSYLEKTLDKATREASVSRRSGCIHCHQIAEREVRHYYNRGRAVPDKILWSYPMPSRVGFECNPDTCATVDFVTSDSAAAKAGLKVGDEILSVDGVPMISIADLQWALHQAPDKGTLALHIRRKSTKKGPLLKDVELKDLELELSEGWRRRDQFAWRYTYNELKWKVLGVDSLTNLDANERETLKIEKALSAIRIGGVITGENRWARTICNPRAYAAGLRRGDIILDVDGKGRQDESQFLAYILQETKPEQVIALTILRKGERQVIRYPVKGIRSSH